MTHYLFSVFRENVCEETNKQNHANVRQALTRQGVPFAEWQGKWKGHQELSFQVSGIGNESVIKRLCKLFNQECYLEVSDSSKESFIVDRSGRRSFVGFFVKLPANEAAQLPAWSFNPRNNTYYHIAPTLVETLVK